MTEAADIRNLMKTRRAPEPNRIPGTELPCAVKLLSDKEIDECKVAAYEHFSKLCKAKNIDPAVFIDLDPEAWEREKTRQIIFRAFVSAVDDEKGKREPIFPGVDAVRDLDTVLVNSLFGLYLDHQSTKATDQALSQESVDAMLPSLLADEKAEGLLAHFEPSGLRLLVRALAKRVRAEAQSE